MPPRCPFNLAAIVARRPSRRAGRGSDARPRHHGFTIIELLFAITLLGLFALAYSRIFNAANAITSAAPRLDADAARVEMALGVLRRDVWQARQIEVSGPHAAMIRADAAGVITWSLGDAGLLRRTVSAPATSAARDGATPVARLDEWHDMASLRGFTAAPAGLIVTLHDRWMQRDSQVLLMSQVLAAGRASP